MDSYPAYKRFIELCASDESSASGLPLERDAFYARTGLDVDPRLALDFWRCVREERESGRTDFENAAYREMIRRRHSIRDYVNERMSLARIRDRRFREWSLRQRRKMLFISGEFRKMAVSVSIAFELSDGCTVQCPFCCFAAGRFRGYFPYSDDNRSLWRGILERSREILGDCVQFAPCYMATEPLDNPDYERFLADFRGLVGALPQTTTALATRDVDRVRTILRSYSVDDLECAALRFSVISRRQLARLFAAFTPEELEHVDLVLNNRESFYRYSDSGRARAMPETDREAKNLKGFTSACVSGFVVNMVNRTISLVSPEPACEAYPLGYDLFGTEEFTGVESYAVAMENLIRKWIPRSLPRDMRLRLNRRIRWERSDDYLKIIGDGKSRLFSCPPETFGCLAAMEESGPAYDEYVAAAGLSAEADASLHAKLDLLFSLGYIQEHPASSE